MIAGTVLLEESLLLKIEGVTVIVTGVGYSTTEEQRGKRLTLRREFPHSVNLSIAMDTFLLK